MPKKEDAKTWTLKSVTVDVPDEGDTYPAKITSLEVKPASEIFGDKAKDPTRPTIDVGFSGPGGVDGHDTLSAPGITDGGTLVVRNPKSNLFKFVKRYKKGPSVGMPVEVRIDENGFYRILLEG